MIVRLNTTDLFHSLGGSGGNILHSARHKIDKNNVLEGHLFINTILSTLVPLRPLYIRFQACFRSI